MSAVAIWISINKDKPKQEQPKQRLEQVCSEKSIVQSNANDELNELNESYSNTDSLNTLPLYTVKIDTLK
tara:strand:- start:5595 stop:5804 length:210 start_codon:yes stop_codon:yes gene_type:complete